MGWILDLLRSKQKHSLISAVENKLAELDALTEYERSSRKQIKQDLDGIVMRLASLPEDERMEVAACLYWEYDQVGAKKVLEAAGLSIKDVSSSVRVVCRECGSKFLRPVKSRSEYKFIKKFYDENGHGGTCPACDAKEIARIKAIRVEDQVARQQLREMPYQDFLKTEFWDEVRKRKLKQSHYACQLCNTRQSRLNVHHRTYEHHGEEDMYLNDLIVLCEVCHGKFHDKLAEYCA